MVLFYFFIFFIFIFLAGVFFAVFLTIILSIILKMNNICILCSRMVSWFISLLLAGAFSKP